MKSYDFNIVFKVDRPTDADLIERAKFIRGAEGYYLPYDSLEKAQSTELKWVNWAGEADRLDEVEIIVTDPKDQVVPNPKADKLREMYLS